jgi:hypothetical protein
VWPSASKHSTSFGPSPSIPTVVVQAAIQSHRSLPPKLPAVYGYLKFAAMAGTYWMCYAKYRTTLPLAKAPRATVEPVLAHAPECTVANCHVAAFVLAPTQAATARLHSIDCPSNSEQNFTCSLGSRKRLEPKSQIALTIDRCESGEDESPMPESAKHDQCLGVGRHSVC